MARSPPKHWIPASGAGAHSRASSITGVTNRQQLDREPDPADCHWTRQLIVCGLAQSRAACGCGHESDPECQAQWAQSLCLSERCAAAPAHAQEQSGCRIIASSLAACPDVTADRLTIAATVAARGFRPPPTPYRPFDICSPPLAGLEARSGQIWPRIVGSSHLRFALHKTGATLNYRDFPEKHMRYPK